MCALVGFQVNCVSQYWELRLRNGDVLRVVTSHEEGRVLPQRVLSSSPGKGARSKERPQQKVCYGAGDETWGLRLGRTEGAVKLCSQFTCFKARSG